MRVLMIGAGNMGSTYARGISKSSLLDGRKVQIFDHNKDKIKKLQEEGFLEVFFNLEDCLPIADIVFIAVKPQQAHDLFEEMRPLINDTQMFVSIMAGVRLQTLSKGLKRTKIVRTMPNLPAQIGLGVTAFTASKGVTHLELLLIRNFLNMTGKSIHVESENFTDAATAISGSGPAYVFYFMQALIEAAEKMGFSSRDAHLLVSSTFEGAVKIFQNSNLDLKEWMEKVSSKGGTTQAAFESFQKSKMKELIKKGAFAAYERAIALGKEK